MIATKTLSVKKHSEVRNNTIREKYNGNEGLSEKDIKGLIQERERLIKKVEELNITEEMRTKKASDLTEDDKDILYEEYVLNSVIASTTDFIEGRYYTYNEFKQIIKEMWGEEYEL